MRQIIADIYSLLYLISDFWGLLVARVAEQRTQLWRGVCWLGDEALLVEHLPSMSGALVPSLPLRAMVAHVLNPSTQEVVAGGSEV